MMMMGIFPLAIRSGVLILNKSYHLRRNSFLQSMYRTPIISLLFTILGEEGELREPMASAILGEKVIGQRPDDDCYEDNRAIVHGLSCGIWRGRLKSISRDRREGTNET